VDFELTDEQRLLRDTVREFARSEVAPVAEELDRTKSFPYELVERMGKLGLMGIPFPEEFVDGKPWGHLDIAGTAWDVGREYVKKGPTGFGVRLLIAFARGLADRG